MIIDERRVKTELVAFLMACAAAWICVGCGPAKPPEVHPIWPPPPSPARIAHRKNIHGPADLVEPSFFQKLIRSITGENDLTLIRPHGVAVEEGKRLYVTDQELQGVVVYSLTSSCGRIIDRVGEVFLVSPVGVAACGETFAVADSALNTVFVLTPEGELVRKFTTDDGIKRPTGLAFDRKTGLLYVVDTLAHNILVFELKTGRLVRKFGSPGDEAGQFNFPTHIFVDTTGRVYVTDSLNSRVQVFSAEGKYAFHIGSPGDASGHLGVPKGVGVDSHGHIYIVDSYFSAIQIFSQNGAFLMDLGGPGESSGRLQVPTGLAVDSQNRIYVCDSYNNRVQILEYVGGKSHE